MIRCTSVRPSLHALLLRSSAALAVLLLGATPGFAAPEAASGPSLAAGRTADRGAMAGIRAPDAIATFTEGMQSQEGFIPLHLDPETGSVYLEVDRLSEDIRYMTTLASGLGSFQPVRLDRGETGDAAVIRFQRQGPRVLLVRQNVRFTASSGDPDELRSVRESFPPSVLASLPVVEEEGDRLLVDATDFFLSDVWGVRGEFLEEGIEGVRLDRERSYVTEENTGAFPINTEVRVTLTFASDDPHPLLERHAPDGRSITLQQHHSFMELPERPLPRRPYDPRLGVGDHVLEDYSQPLDGEYRLRSVSRWRLEPSDPEAYMRGELVEPVEPIVYHLDPAIPEPYRSAYREGASWWNEAFEAAGFRNAFQVRDLPEGVDRLDARYSVIQVVHRTAPGPSNGNTFDDPRTGEVIQGMPKMDSHRSLTDYNIYAGLLPAFDAQGVQPQLSGEEFAMARRRQLAAHEVGHSLGLPHNHSGASQGRNSVMDYPFPLVRLNDGGQLDVSDAYAVGVGYSDSLAIRYTYTWFPNAEAEREGLEAIAQEALDRGHKYITGGHARDLAGSQPDSHMWWEGSDTFEALDRTQAVRSVLLEHFDERAIRPGEPMAWLNQRLAHAYLHHRYSVEAVAKNVGGMYFRYALRGDGQAPTQVVPASDQRRALERIAEVLSPEELAVPPGVAELIPPAPAGFDERVPWIPSPAGPTLDPLAIARSFAQEVVDNLLHRERLARVASFHARDPDQLSLEDVMGRLVEATWGDARSASGSEAAYARAAERAVLDGLFTLVGHDQVTAEVKNAAERHLVLLRDRLEGDPGESAEDRAQRARAAREIEGYLADGEVPPLRTGVIELYLQWP